MEEMQEIKNQEIRSFLDEIKKIRQEEEQDKDAPKIKASLTISRLAFFYEKARNSLEYKDEHLIIKSAIERILRRKFFAYNPDQPLAKGILFELISGGYIANDSVPETKIEKITRILDRYYYLFSNLVKRPNRRIIASIVACAIEESLNRGVKEKEVLVNFTYQTIRGKLLLDKFVDEHTVDTQLYIAIHRTLLKSDYQTIRYRLLKNIIPNLEDFDTNIHDILLKFEDANNLIDYLFKDKLKNNFLKFCRKSVPPFSVLGKIIVGTPIEKIEESLNNELEFERITETAYNRWRDRAYSKIGRSAIRSVIFIFFTKMILAFVLEVPYDLIVNQEIIWIPLLLNLMFPPFYMFINTFNISVPGRENLEAIKASLKKVAFDEGSYNYQMKVKKSGSVGKITFFFIYLLTFVISFVGLTYVLLLLHFNIVAITLFFIFFSTINFFVYRISRVANELLVVKSSGGIREAFADFFSVPFIKLGQFFSSNFSKINIFLFILDVIIETPFKAIIQFLEDWVSYAKEKKEDILDE